MMSSLHLARVPLGLEALPPPLRPAATVIVASIQVEPTVHTREKLRSSDTGEKKGL